MTAVSDGHYTPDVPTARHNMPSVSQPLRSVCAVKAAPADKTAPGRFVLNAAVPTVAESSRADSQTNGHCPADVVIDTQHFYISNLDGDEPGDKTEEAYFAGSRDVHGKDKPTRIVSDRGSIRGVKNRVRAGIETFQEKEGAQPKNYEAEEKGQIIVYTTSMKIVRSTSEKCERVRHILQTHMIRYDERDMFMSRENQRELIERFGSDFVDVPQVFADGKYIGDADALEKLNETGELRNMFKHFKRVSRMTSCEQCGGYRYIPCTACHGSKKSLHRNDFTAEFCSLRCIVCNENGLVRCNGCLDATT